MVQYHVLARVYSGELQKILTQMAERGWRLHTLTPIVGLTYRGEAAFMLVFEAVATASREVSAS